MNIAHLHVMLNHFPIIGFMIGFALYAFSFVRTHPERENQDLRRVGLIIFAAIALVTIPTFASGTAAYQWMSTVKPDPILKALMLRHEGAAELALGLILVTGTLSLFGLWQTHRDGRMGTWTTRSVLLFATLSVIVATRAGNTGGDIGHPELRDNPNAMITEGTLGSIAHAFEPNAAKFNNVMSLNKWSTAILMDIHFFGLCLVIAVAGILNLRILGLAKGIPLKALHQFVPWGLFGLGINVATGMLALIGTPEAYNFDIPFWLKLGALMLLGLNAGVFYLSGTFDQIESLGAGDDAPISAKLIAASSLALWIGVVILGRYIQVYCAVTYPATAFHL